MASFDVKFNFGAHGERTVDLWLKSQGMAFLPLHQFGKGEGAPQVKGPEQDFIAPDFVVWSGAGVCHFVECKHHTDWNKFYDPEASVKVKSLDAYKQVAKLTGCPVLIYFLVRSADGGLFKADASSDETSRYWDGLNGRGEYVDSPQRFFQKKDMVQLASVSEIVELEAAASVEKASEG